LTSNTHTILVEEKGMVNFVERYSKGLPSIENKSGEQKP
jgi:hypothetical protein